MERERFSRMRAVLRRVASQGQHNPRCVHSDSTILLVLLWAALSNKPVSWATKRENWPGDLRPRSRQRGEPGLPSATCMSRRLRSLQGGGVDGRYETSLFDLLERWQAALRQQLPDCSMKVIDGRGLVIGGCSKDPDAGYGYTASTKANGYKLHWVIDASSGAVENWLVTPMNYSEKVAAEHLIPHLPAHTRWVLADNNYDTNTLYELAGSGRQVQWLASPRTKAKGVGNHAHSSWRLSVQPLLRSAAGHRLMQARIAIEQVNGRVGSSAVGLNHLPYHARRTHRVNIWVAMKILILTDLQAQTHQRRCA